MQPRQQTVDAGRECWWLGGTLTGIGMQQDPAGSNSRSHGYRGNSSDVTHHYLVVQCRVYTVD